MHGFTTEEDRTPAKRADGPSPRSGVPDRGDRWIRNAGSWPRPRRRLLAFLTCAIARSGTPVSRHEAAPDPGVPELFPSTTSRAQGPHRAPNTTGRAQAHHPKGPPGIGAMASSAAGNPEYRPAGAEREVDQRDELSPVPVLGTERPFAGPVGAGGFRSAGRARPRWRARRRWRRSARPRRWYGAG